MKKTLICTFIIVISGFIALKVSAYQVTLTEISEIHTGSRVYDVKVLDNILYALDIHLGLITYNISDPRAPSLIGYFSNTYTFAHAVHIENNYAFIADYEDGLEIINVSDPTDLTIIGSYSANAGVSAGSTDVYKLDDFVFLGSQSIGLEIINCSNPFNPVKIGSFYEGYNVNRVYSFEDQIYISEAHNGFKILNFTDLECTEIFHFQDTISYQDFFVRNNLLYTISQHGIKIFDISDLLNIVKVGEKDIGASYGLVVKGKLTYVSSWELGLQILDISDPNKIEVKAQYTDGGESFRIDAKNDLIFVVDVQDGLEIIQIDNYDLYSSSTVESSSTSSGFDQFLMMITFFSLFILTKGKRTKD